MINGMTKNFGISVGICLTVCLILPITCDDRIPLKLSFLSSTSRDAKLFAGAFFTALDFVNNNESVLQGYRLEYLFNDTKSSSLNAINAMTSHYGTDTIGFIGPDVSCECESTVAAAWNLPMIGYVSVIIVPLLTCCVNRFFVKTNIATYIFFIHPILW